MRIARLFALALLYVIFVSSIEAQQALQPPSAFDAITDRTQRSRALFEELGKVLTHPRCIIVTPLAINLCREQNTKFTIHRHVAPVLMFFRSPAMGVTLIGISECQSRPHSKASRDTRVGSWPRC